MIDPEIRRRKLLSIARRSDIAVVVCDVILGWGAHPDPAAVLSAAWKATVKIAHAEGRKLIGIAIVCGTSEDPQVYDRQCRLLHRNGFIVTDSNARAVRLAAAAAGIHAKDDPDTQTAKGTGRPPLSGTNRRTMPEAPLHLPALLAAGPRVINIGLDLFVPPLKAHGVPVIHVDWRPPAGGDARLASLLDRLR
jgi:FdrA protein